MVTLTALTDGHFVTGPITTTPLSTPESHSTGAAAPPTPTLSTATPTHSTIPTPTLSPVAELEQRLRESHGDSVVIDWEFSEVNGGYTATVLAPGVGYVRGDVCTSKSKAKKSAAAEALKALS